MLAFFKTVFFIMGYIALVGPPRALEIKSRADKNQDELAGKPLWLVMLVEFILRGGLFLVIAVVLESMIGDSVYELYQLDLFLGALIISGIIHTFFYYLAFGWFMQHVNSSARIYRLGRNFAYAVIPAFFASGFALVWQQLNQLPLFNGQLVETAFMVTWAVFLFFGLLEALLVKRAPTGLGENTHNHFSSDR